MASQPNLKPARIRTPTIIQHEHQAIWQIWLPLAIAIVIIVALMVFVVLTTAQGTTQVTRWRDVSMIAMIAPGLMAALMITLVLVGLIYGLVKLLKVLPTFTIKIQAIFYLINQGVYHRANQIASPFLNLRSCWAGLKAFLKVFFH